MILTRKRAALFLVLGLLALLVAGAGGSLCIESDGHVVLEQAARSCCPGEPTDARRVSPEAAESSGDGKPCGCDCCIDLPLIASMPAIVLATDGDVLVWLEARFLAGATLSPKPSDAVLASFPGHGRNQRSVSSQLFARTVSLRC